jgi:16S rRNA (cytosine967-C5)-methyltransferase
MAPTSRKLALDVLNRLMRSEERLDPILADVLAAAPFSDPRDRSLFHHLVLGVLRWRGRLDWIIEQVAKRPLSKIDPSVLNALRMGLFQVAFLDRIPVSAAVNTTVELVKADSSSRAAGFVNAVLRKAATEWRQIPLPDAKQSADRHLAVRESFPRWMVRRWISRFGFAEAAHLCAAANQIPPITVRANTLKTDRSRLRTALAGAVEDIRETAHAPDGLRFSHPSTPIDALPMFQEGGFQVQDEAAQLIALLLGPAPGQRVLDACAGLGGKTGHIAQLMENRGVMVAIDKDAAKLETLRNEMERLGVTIVQPVSADLEAPLGDSAERFDRILLDAPCSGLGVIRRNPDAKWKSAGKDLSRFGARQKRLLHRLAGLVSPSGLLVYSVCSMEPEENESVVDAFLDAHPEFAVVHPAERRRTLPQAFFDARGFFRSFPHRHGTDGFFAAVLRRHRNDSNR